MRIACICTEKLPVPPVSGGAIQIYIEGVLPYLSMHHEITVFGIKSDKLPDEEVFGNVRYKRVLGRTKNEYLDNIKANILDEYHLIHVFNRPLWVLPLKEQAPGSYFSLSLHNEMFMPNKINKERALKCINTVEFITTVSRFIADGVKGLYPVAEDKLNVVYSGVAPALYSPVYAEEHLEERKALRKKYGLDKHKVVLFVGRLSQKKGPQVLVQAMQEIMEAYPDTALMIVGSKWYGGNTNDTFTHQLKTMVEGLKGSVVFTGFLPPYEIPRHFSVGDIFVCASQWREPLARVHYEAMAAGLPIITTDRGGNAEVIRSGYNGLVVKEFNRPEAIAEKIRYLLNHEAIARSIGMMGRKIAEEQYNWERVANQLLELFATV
ncbi:MAG: glycosyltransferase family 4 protein [Bacillota bacterium]